MLEHVWPDWGDHTDVNEKWSTECDELRQNLAAIGER